MAKEVARRGTVAAALLMALAVLAGCEKSDTGAAAKLDDTAPRHPAMAPGGPLGGLQGSPGLQGGAHGRDLPHGHPVVGDTHPGDPSQTGGIGSVPGGAAPSGAPGAGGAPAGGGREVVIGPLALTAPEEWVPRVNTSGFVQAEYALPRKEGDQEDGRLTVSAVGGSTEENINRWRGQFKENPPAATQEMQVQGLRTVIVKLAGTLSGGGGPMMKTGGADKPNSKLWGAIIELPIGQKIFVKATGPAGTVDRWEESMSSFVRSMKKSG